MKPITSNIIYLVVAGSLIFSVGSLTYTFSSQKNIDSKQNEIAGTSSQTIKNTSKDLDDDYEDADDSRSVSTTPTNPPSTQPTTTKSFTASDVAPHNNQTSCWTIVNGNVYDVTSYATSHPGGERAILSLCGTNGSSAFSNQHGGSSKPENVLKSFLIGQLK